MQFMPRRKGGSRNPKEPSECVFTPVYLDADIASHEFSEVRFHLTKTLARAIKGKMMELAYDGTISLSGFQLLDSATASSLENPRKPCPTFAGSDYKGLFPAAAQQLQIRETWLAEVIEKLTDADARQAVLNAVQQH